MSNSTGKNNTTEGRTCQPQAIQDSVAYPTAQGIMTALITPFAKNGDVDFDALTRIVNRQLEAGIHGLVVCGTTGEAMTLDLLEILQIVRHVKALTVGKVPLWVGAGGNSTKAVIAQSTQVTEAGADGLLIVTPYYNKPSQDGLIAHYTAVHEATRLPILLYNVAGRTGVNMAVETAVALSALPRIIGLKDASPDLSRPAKLAAALAASGQKTKPFSILSGEDATAAAFWIQGGHGTISVTSNIAPKCLVQQWQAFLDNDWPRFHDLRNQLVDLHEALFLDSSPMPAKWFSNALGLCTADCRLPLTQASSTAVAALQSVLNNWNGDY